LDTQVLHARTTMLLERYGVVSREAAAAEGLPGGFSSIAPVLRAFEESGRIRRGYFIEGLGGAQYAQPGAVDRLRAAREPASDEAASTTVETPGPSGAGKGGDDAVALAAVDPANPYGALLPWPGADGIAEDGAQGGDGATDDGTARGRPRRVAGALVVLVRGAPVLYVERGGHGLRTFDDDDDGGALEAALRVLRGVAARRRHHELRVESVNGVAALRSPLVGRLERGGFRVEPGALVLSPEAAD
jgi:ATP-dependent Lhr-like helicase